MSEATKRWSVWTSSTSNRRSWLFDILLLIRTIGVVITGRGAY